MTYERPRAFGGGVPLTEKNILSKPAGYARPLSRASGSGAPNGSPGLGLDDRPYSAGRRAGSKENVATPVKNIINPNITPRSGSRKARAETASPQSYVTPYGTPTTAQVQSPIEKRGTDPTEHRTSNGSGIRGLVSGRTSRSESLISDGPGSRYTPRPALVERQNSSYSSNGITSPKGPAVFFRANDVQATVSSKQPRDNSSPQANSQGWSNGVEGGIPGWISATSNDELPDEQESKFLYANDAVQSKPSTFRPSSSMTTNRPPLQTIYSAYVPTSPQRAPSPLKEEVVPPVPRKSSISKASPRRHTRLVSNGGTEIKAPEAIKTDLSRRSSVTSRTAGRTSTNHVRSPSVASHTAGSTSTSHVRSSSVTSRTGGSTITSHVRPPSAQSIGRSPSKRNSFLQLDDSPVEPTKRTSVVEANGLPAPTFSPDHARPFSPGLPQSPTKHQSKLDQMNELAANARRERKVLDLEISNSSLLAINRTLEREMRKQNAELRRYRRLSRSGRLSVAPTSHPGRESKSSKTDTAIESDDLLSNSDAEVNDEDIFSVQSSHSNASDPPSAHAARARFQDQDKPSLDLSAHRLLLLESQKMNQSIKRCLNHSDALIAVGRQALQQQAQQAETENLGPKVLTPDEYNEHSIEQGQGLLSPGLGHRGPNINPWERSFAQIGGLDGGLETPDYTKWGPETEPELPVYHAHEHSHDDEPMGTPIGDGAWAGGVEELSSGLLKQPSTFMEPQVDAQETTTATTTTSTPQSSDAPGEDVSFQASLDGLDSTHSSPSPAPVLEPDKASFEEEDEESRPPSPSRPPPTTNAAANTPGNRSSIQNFGTYLGLQSLNIFGQSNG